MCLILRYACVYMSIPAAGAMYNNALFVHLDKVLYDPTWLPKALTTICTKICCYCRMLVAILPLPTHGSKTLLLLIQPCPEAHPVTAMYPKVLFHVDVTCCGVPQSLADASTSNLLCLSLPSLIGGPSSILTYIVSPRRSLHDIRTIAS